MGKQCLAIRMFSLRKYSIQIATSFHIGVYTTNGCMDLILFVLTRQETLGQIEFYTLYQKIANHKYELFVKNTDSI